MTLRIKRTEEIDDRRIVFQIKIFSCTTQEDEGEEEESNTKKEIAEIAPFLTVYQHDTQEECGEHDYREIDIIAQRHNPCRKRGTDIGTHDDGDGLSQGEKTCVDKGNRHHGSSRRTLHGTGNKCTCKHTREPIGCHRS